MTPQEKLSELFKKLNTTNQPINLGDLLDLQETLKSYEEKILEQSFKDIESIIETIFQENTTLSEPLKKKWEAHKRKFGVEKELLELLPPVIRKKDRFTGEIVSLVLRIYPEVQFSKNRTKWDTGGYWCGYYGSIGVVENEEKFSLLGANEAMGLMYEHLLKEGIIKSKE